MKKLLILLTVIVLIVLSVVSVAAESRFNIRIHEDGNGVATYFYDYDNGIVSIGVEETDEPFKYLDIKGDYEIINDEKDGKIYHIRPFSDLDVTAVFNSELNEKSEITCDSTFIKTGMGNISFVLIVLIIALAAILLPLI